MVSPIVLTNKKKVLDTPLNRLYSELFHVERFIMKIHLHHKYGYVTAWDASPLAKNGMSCSYSPLEAMDFPTITTACIARIEIAIHMSWPPSDIVVVTVLRSAITTYVLPE